VPLLTQAIDVLNALKMMTGNYHYVFPRRNDLNKLMSEASINQVIKCIGYSCRVTGHGFRHMLPIISHENNYSTNWIEMQLAHSNKIVLMALIINLNMLKRRNKIQLYSEMIFS